MGARLNGIVTMTVWVRGSECHRNKIFIHCNITVASIKNIKKNKLIPIRPSYLIHCTCIYVFIFHFLYLCAILMHDGDSARVVSVFILYDETHKALTDHCSSNTKSTIQRTHVQRRIRHYENLYSL